MDVHVYVLSVLGCFVNCIELFCPCRDFTARQTVSRVYLELGEILCVCNFFHFFLSALHLLGLWGFVWALICAASCVGVLFGGEGIFALKFAAQILHIVSRMKCWRFSVCSCCRVYNCTTDVVQVSNATLISLIASCLSLDRMSAYYDPTCVWLRVDWRSGWNIGTIYIMKNNSVVTACFDIGLSISMFVRCVWNACYFILLLCKRCVYVKQKWVKLSSHNFSGGLDSQVCHCTRSVVVTAGCLDPVSSGSIIGRLSR